MCTWSVALVRLAERPQTRAQGLENGSSSFAPMAMREGKARYMGDSGVQDGGVSNREPRCRSSSKEGCLEAPRLRQLSLRAECDVELKTKRKMFVGVFQHEDESGVRQPPYGWIPQGTSTAGLRNAARCRRTGITCLCADEMGMEGASQESEVDIALSVPSIFNIQEQRKSPDPPVPSSTDALDPLQPCVNLMSLMPPSSPGQSPFSHPPFMKILAPYCSAYVHALLLCTSYTSRANNCTQILEIWETLTVREGSHNTVDEATNVSYRNRSLIHHAGLHKGIDTPRIADRERSISSGSTDSVSEPSGVSILRRLRDVFPNPAKSSGIAWTRPMAILTFTNTGPPRREPDLITPQVSPDLLRRCQLAADRASTPSKDRTVAAKHPSRDSGKAILLFRAVYDYPNGYVTGTLLTVAINKPTRSAIRNQQSPIAQDKTLLALRNKSTAPGQMFGNNPEIRHHLEDDSRNPYSYLGGMAHPSSPLIGGEPILTAHVVGACEKHPTSDSCADHDEDASSKRHSCSLTRQHTHRCAAMPTVDYSIQDGMRSGR
ncbi:hypothetical protein BDP55DRAFT_630614 [Colletotrichum godetiae]|uniref:Uncharacterized protein n=1 Tax=Colletotrichum godetiae TaxID=1209918 RepID=A0AAJ0ANF5_9PEZI|nr:uncharacterized protein BDP55DRAFT_630614 [Colletotrichum godetiae]KAK1687420.1 hypothetical protein BDP55DRAFT_630614 [Colletotrichum godetiae]